MRFGQGAMPTHAEAVPTHGQCAAAGMPRGAGLACRFVVRSLLLPTSSLLTFSDA